MYRLADPSAEAPSGTIVRVGETGSETLTVANNAATDGYSEDLIAGLTGTGGDFNVGTAGPTGDITAGSSSTALSVSFSTTQAGTATGTATIGLNSDGGTGPGSIDGLGQLALTPRTLDLDAVIDNYATAAIESTGSLSGGGDEYLLNLGTTGVGDAPLTGNLSLLNDALTGEPSDLLDATFAVDGTDPFSNFGFDPLTGIEAGNDDEAGTQFARHGLRRDLRRDDRGDPEERERQGKPGVAAFGDDRDRRHDLAPAATAAISAAVATPVTAAVAAASLAAAATAAFPAAAPVAAAVSAPVAAAIAAAAFSAAAAADVAAPAGVATAAGDAAAAIAAGAAADAAQPDRILVPGSASGDVQRPVLQLPDRRRIRAGQGHQRRHLRGAGPTVRANRSLQLQRHHRSGHPGR